MTEFVAGQIVLADWRGNAIPPEPNKLRPAIVIEDHELFGPAYPMVILVPLTSDEGLANADLSVIIDPTTDVRADATRWHRSCLARRLPVCDRLNHSSLRGNWRGCAALSLWPLG